MKQPTGGETLIPEPVLAAWRRDAALQARFPQPLDLSAPDNLMIWAKRDGVRVDPAIRAAIESDQRFDKRLAPAGPFHRGTVEGWPLELLEAVEPQPPMHVRLGRLGGRDMTVTLPDAWFKTGWRGVIRRPVEAVIRWAQGRLRGN